MVGYDPVERIVWVVSSARTPFTVQSIRGWRVEVLSGVPQVHGRYTGFKIYSGGGYGTLGAVHGRLGLTAAHVVGEVWKSTVGARVRVHTPWGAVHGVVKSSTTLRPRSAASKVVDAVAGAVGAVRLAGPGNKADAALIELEGSVPGTETWSDYGIVVAGSPQDRLSVAVKLSNVLTALGVSPGELGLNLREARVGDKVYKVGASSGLTEGVVEAVNARIIVDYSGREILLEDVIVIRGTGGPFSVPGDSGSLVWGR